ncbi:HAD family hydrolase [Haladaptatus halobius]|uniref:HAD family hydrolase n=1 Tax=Haladaptatus halobius TaxID=2884875 RepID=UPI001D0BBB50|nr:HAD family hydrolase [Haladaptatus halobius]
MGVNDNTTDWAAVFWDIGGVLLAIESARTSHRRFIEALAREHGLLASVNEALETWRTEIGRYFREREGTEFRSSQVAYRIAVEAVIGEPIPQNEWRSLFEQVQRKTLRPNPGAVETVERLATTDLHVGIISDIDGAEAQLILECFGLEDAFDSITTSQSVGQTKPAPAMFKTALGKADVLPSSALMIGDRYKHDMAGAADVGLQTVAYGADDGPAVDYRVDDLRDILDIVDARC